MKTVDLITLKVENNKHQVTAKKKTFITLFYSHSHFPPLSILQSRNSQRTEPFIIEERQQIGKAWNTNDVICIYECHEWKPPTPTPSNWRSEDAIRGENKEVA